MRGIAGAMLALLLTLTTSASIASALVIVDLGAVAQSGERRAGSAEVGGSYPPGSTMILGRTDCGLSSLEHETAGNRQGRECA